MKIGVLTYHDSDNFGSVLQAFALSKYLKEQEKDCRIIDYRKPEVKAMYRIFKPFNSPYNILTNFYNALYYHQLVRGKARYEAFRGQLPLTRERYESADRIPTDGFDCYIAGSDQVWNMDIIDFDPVYLLRGMQGRKLSYAASFGPGEKPVEKLVPFREDLLALDAISVRESAAKTACEALGVTAQEVCDPVFLLDKASYEQAATPCKKKPKDYVFCYFPGGVPSALEKFSKDLAKKLNCRRVLVMPQWRNIFRSGRKIYDCGPGEFLDLLQNARCICTSSFHGTAFALVLGKACYTYHAGTDHRIRSLLALVERQSLEDVTDGITYICDTPVKTKLGEHIRASKEFLREYT